VAYQSSSCGQVWSVLPGNHGLQVLLENAALSACSSPVVFQGAIGVEMGEIRFGQCAGCFATNAADRITIKGPLRLFQGISAISDAHNITIDGADGGSFTIDSFGNPDGPKNWLVRNSDWGPCWSSGPNEETNCNPWYGNTNHQIEIGGGNVGDTSTNNIQFLDNTIHDFSLAGPTDHYECVRMSGGSNHVWRGNKFWNCQIYALSTTNWGGVNYIENNWFGGANHADADPVLKGLPRGTALTSDPNVPGTIYVRFNSFSSLDGITSDTGSDHARWHIIGNLIGLRQCFANAVYRYNIYDDGGACPGEGNVGGVPFQYVNGARNANMNYHLAAAWLADNFVPGSVPKSDLAVDFDMEVRTAPRDAGSDER
jgi:hypothetical protein